MATVQKKKTVEKYILRLKRVGPHGEGGLARYYFEKKLYKRAGLYGVPKDRARLMLSTGKFERIMPEDLELARKEAKRGRGISINERMRQKRRAAMLRKRRQYTAAEDDGDEGLIIEDSGDAAEGDEEDSLAV